MILAAGSTSRGHVIEGKGFDVKCLDVEAFR